ncbi:MAG: hypothetical protein JSV53_11525 [candidate division WOR-3 bacterium]|nr:MAG: hypothetical protein JSV53_11525 [candidate division WOR-3 bacterium]
MSINIEKIINEIQRGNILTESADDYRSPYPLGLPHCPYVAEDGITDCLRAYDLPGRYR